MLQRLQVAKQGKLDSDFRFRDKTLIGQARLPYKATALLIPDSRLSYDKASPKISGTPWFRDWRPNSTDTQLK